MGQTCNDMYHFCSHSFTFKSIIWPNLKKTKQKTGECSPALHTKGKRDGKEITSLCHSCED